MKSSMLQKAVAFAFAAVFSTAIAGGAMAQTQWDKTHPRRDQVNHRLANQNKRIHHEVKDGQMSKAKAARLHAADRHVRHDERRMASNDHGHITKVDQRRLNRQENRVSHHIGQ